MGAYRDALGGGGVAGEVVDVARHGGAHRLEVLDIADGDIHAAFA